MRKGCFNILFLATSLCAAVACSDDGTPPPTTPPGGGDGEGGSNVPVATVEQAQQEIDRVSKAFMAKVDAEQLQPVVNLAAYCEQTFFSGDEYAENGGGAPYYGLQQMANTFRKAASGDFTIVASYKRIGEIYSLTEYYGNWVWDETEKQWDQTDGSGTATALTYTFQHEGQTCVASVKGSGSTYTLQRTDSTGYVLETLEVPATVTASITKGGQALAEFVVNITRCELEGKVLEMNSTFTVGNLKAEGTLSDNNTEANAGITLYANGNEQLARMACNVNGNNLADAEVIEGGYFDGQNDLKAGTVACNIMESMSINFTADNYDRTLADAFDFDGYYYYNEYHYSYMDTTYVYAYSSNEESLAKATAAAQTANSKVQAGLYFANSTYSTPVTFAPVHYEYYNYEWHDPDDPGSYSKSYSGKWDIEPLLNFQDGTTYSFGQYFTSTRFTSIIEVYNELMDRITAGI